MTGALYWFFVIGFYYFSLSCMRNILLISALYVCVWRKSWNILWNIPGVSTLTTALRTACHFSFCKFSFITRNLAQDAQYSGKFIHENIFRMKQFGWQSRGRNWPPYFLVIFSSQTLWTWLTWSIFFLLKRARIKCNWLQISPSFLASHSLGLFSGK